MGDPQTVGLEWKIPLNGWFRGTRILGNLHMVMWSTIQMSYQCLWWSCFEWPRRALCAGLQDSSETIEQGQKKSNKRCWWWYETYGDSRMLQSQKYNEVPRISRYSRIIQWYIWHVHVFYMIFSSHTSNKNTVTQACQQRQWLGAWDPVGYVRPRPWQHGSGRSLKSPKKDRERFYRFYSMFMTNFWLHSLLSFWGILMDSIYSMLLWPYYPLIIWHRELKNHYFGLGTSSIDEPVSIAMWVYIYPWQLECDLLFGENVGQTNSLEISDNIQLLAGQ